ncbi:MAG: dUTP diphosphatase [Parcubacteria group bacterium]
MVHLIVHRLNPQARIPKRHTEHDAGIDLYTTESYLLRPGETHAFATGIATQFEQGYVALIWDRSSLGARGVHAFAGVIDAGYRGEWKVVLHNASDETVAIQKGDRVAQAIIQRFDPVLVSEAPELDQSPRGKGAFGSSGR